MPPSKKRKQASPPALPNPPQLSAVARRKQREQAASGGATPNTTPNSPIRKESATYSSVHNESSGATFQSEVPQTDSLLGSNLTQPSVRDANVAATTTNVTGEELSGQVTRKVQDHIQPGDLKPPNYLDGSASRLKTAKDELDATFHGGTQGSLQVSMTPGERLVVLGQYGLSVLSGVVSLMGMTLHPDKEKIYRIDASCVHALPVIRCASEESIGIRVRLHQCRSGLSSLQDLSPLFGKLWNTQGDPLRFPGESFFQVNTRAKEKNHEPSTFKVIFSNRDGPLNTPLSLLQSPTDWNRKLSSLSNTGTMPRRFMVCGPKSTGKSTFARLLVNKLLSDQIKANQRPEVFLLDIDPGQPEYSIPGQLSLIRVRTPNFSTPFSHPTPSGHSEVVRAHSIGAISPANDPEHFVACAIDLHDSYRRKLKPDFQPPLVINTPGWVLGTGLEILVTIIKSLKPTDLIYTSLDGPSEVVETLTTARKNTVVSEISSQEGGPKTRTAAQFRTMQYMSYFHLKPAEKTTKTKKTKEKFLAWDGECLSSKRPWEVIYSGENTGIAGVLCYGEQPPANLLADKINGSLVSIVVIEDMKALVSETAEALDITDSSDQKLAWIITTPKEKIPYFNPASHTTLNPTYSHSLGLALIRGIDVERRSFQILTPIDPSILEDLNKNGKNIVLLSGKLDNPGWAYTEAAIKVAASSKTMGHKRDTSDEEAHKILFGEVSDQSEDDGFDELKMEEVCLQPHQMNAPWVQKLEGHSGRGSESRVWRVRRDLGKSNDGGN